MTTKASEKTRERDALRALSARIGADPTLIQGAGGNTSVKQDAAMWIKASGTWLARAQEQDVFVPVALAPLMEAWAKGDERAEKGEAFVLADANPSRLRPSIETTVHAVMPQRVVLHVHCVDTIAIAVRNDAETLLERRLAGLDWIFVPYARPGLPLSHAIAQRLTPACDILILGNHGLVVAGETVDEAEALLKRVCARLKQPVRPAPPADLTALAALARASRYAPSAMAQSHFVATDPVSCRIAAGGSLYPDHVIFLGPSLAIVADDTPARFVAEQAAAQGVREPSAILFAGRGVLMHADATDGARVMVRCLADTAARIDAGASLRYLDGTEIDALTNWDAERYRQAIDSSRPRRDGRP